MKTQHKQDEILSHLEVNTRKNNYAIIPILKYLPAVHTVWNDSYQFEY